MVSTGGRDRVIPVGWQRLTLEKGCEKGAEAEKANKSHYGVGYHTEWAQGEDSGEEG